MSSLTAFVRVSALTTKGYLSIASPVMWNSLAIDLGAITSILIRRFGRESISPAILDKLRGSGCPLKPRRPL